MSGELIDPEDYETVTLSNGQQCSMQVVQAIYREVTGKSEKLGKEYQINHQTSFQDLEQLNHKIEHLLEQYMVRNANCNVTIYHIDESRESFSSFDRARVYESALTSPTENIRLEYNFLIIPPKINKPQPYKVVVDVHSRVALHKKAKSESSFAEEIIHLIASRTGHLSIEYVDYAIAKTMMSAVDQWFDGLPQTESSWFEKMSKRYAKNLPFVFKFGTGGLVAYVIFKKYLISLTEPNANQVISYLFLSLIVFYLSAGVASKLGYVCSDAIERFQKISYIKINRGDEKVIQDFNGSIVKVYVRLALAFLSTILINIASAFVMQFIGL